MKAKAKISEERIQELVMTLFNIYFKNSYKISHIPKGNSDSNVESIEF